MSKYTYTPTVICDIDGVLLETTGNLDQQITSDNAWFPVALPGTIQKFIEWDRMGVTLVLLSGRPESSRKETEEQLKKAGLWWDQLVLGVGGGVRVLINDRKPPNAQYPEGRITAFAISPPRNHGIKNIDIDLLEKLGNNQELTTMDQMDLAETNNMYKS